MKWARRQARRGMKKKRAQCVAKKLVVSSRVNVCRSTRGIARSQSMSQLKSKLRMRGDDEERRKESGRDLEGKPLFMLLQSEE